MNRFKNKSKQFDVMELSREEKYFLPGRENPTSSGRSSLDAFLAQTYNIFSPVKQSGPYSYSFVAMGSGPQAQTWSVRTPAIEIFF